nr:hypothetical protein [Hyphomonas sp. Mor2]
MLNILTRTWVLVGLFIAMLAIGYSFSFVQEAAGGALLDTLGTGAEAKARLAEMSADQKTAHFWGTVLNDTAYPFAYGGLLIGLIWRFAGTLRRWFVFPAFAVIVVDLTENTTQALALSGNEALIGLKDVLTPTKFGLFALAAVLALISIGLAILRHFRTRNSEG